MKVPLDVCPRLLRQHDMTWEDIILMEGKGNYTMIYLRNGMKILTSRTLKRFDCLVPVEQFWRINKTYLIRCDQIIEWHHSTQRMLCLTLASGQVCEVSRRRRTWVRKHLKNQPLNAQNKLSLLNS